MTSPSSSSRDVVEVPALSGGDILVISEDEFDAPQEISLSFARTSGHKVADEILKISQYYHGNIYLKLEKIVDPAYRLCNIIEKHSKDLAESMHTQGYHYKLHLMKVLFSAGRNSN